MLSPARCALFGYALNEMKVDGQRISSRFLRPSSRSPGEEGYDKGAEILYKFFDKELARLRLRRAAPRRQADPRVLQEPRHR